MLIASVKLAVLLTRTCVARPRPRPRIELSRPRTRPRTQLSRPRTRPRTQISRTAQGQGPKARDIAKNLLSLIFDSDQKVVKSHTQSFSDLFSIYNCNCVTISSLMIVFT